jgi:CRISPR/Cas system-associated exonuclease Cas4 (RecB family)
LHKLSKSNLTTFRQCPKRLWLEVYRRKDALNAPDAKRRMAEGDKIGEIARVLFSSNSDGRLIDIKAQGVDEAIRKTSDILPDRQPIFEAGFESNGARCFVDILLPSGNNADPEWRIVEVKSSTKLKPYHLEDASIQAYIAAQSGIAISSIAVAHVDSGWTYQGDENYQGLLTEVDVTEEAKAKISEIAGWIKDAQEVVAAPEPPLVTMGKHCKTPHECGFQHICKEGQNQAEFPVEWLAGRLHKDIQSQQRLTPALDMRDIDDSLLNSDQKRIKDATISGQPYFNQPAAAAELENYSFPLYFLDFETIQTAVPRWAGTKPYQQLPFQFSLHRLNSTSSWEHREFLDLSGNDPSRSFAQKLVEGCGNDGAIFVYNASFEAARIRELSEKFDDLSSALLSLNERMVDLHPVAKRHFYHPSQQGSWSIKYVLPAICPDMVDAYQSLVGVQNGTMAMDAYVTATELGDMDPAKAGIAEQLKAYCKLDTWAMVRIWSALTAVELASSTGDMCHKKCYLSDID